MSSSLPPPPDPRELAERVSAVRQDLESVEARLRAIADGLPEPVDTPTVLTTRHAVRAARRQGMLLVGAGSGVLLVGILVGVVIGRPSSTTSTTSPPAMTTQAKAPPPPQPTPPERAIPDPEPPRDPVPAVTIAATATTTAAPSAAPEPKKTKGFVSITTHPSARVIEGDRILGTTPLVKAPFEPGEHTLLLEGPDGAKKTVHLTIASGETYNLRYSMTDYGF